MNVHVHKYNKGISITVTDKISASFTWTTRISSQVQSNLPENKMDHPNRYRRLMRMLTTWSPSWNKLTKTTTKMFGWFTPNENEGNKALLNTNSPRASSMVTASALTPPEQVCNNVVAEESFEQQEVNLLNGQRENLGLDMYQQDLASEGIIRDEDDTMQQVAGGHGIIEDVAQVAINQVLLGNGIVQDEDRDMQHVPVDYGILQDEQVAIQQVPEVENQPETPPPQLPMSQANVAVRSTAVSHPPVSLNRSRSRNTIAMRTRATTRLTRSTGVGLPVASTPRSSTARHVKQEARRRSPGNSPKCCTCNKVFQNKQGLSAHQKVHVSLPVQWVCTTCGRDFKHKSGFKQHERTHNLTIPCVYCGIKFGAKTHLTAHQRWNKKCIRLRQISQEARRH